MLRRLNASCSLNSSSWKRIRAIKAISSSSSSLAAKAERLPNTSSKSNVLKRERELQESGTTLFPRLAYSKDAVTCAAFHTKYANLQPNQSLDSQPVVLQGASTNDMFGSEKDVNTIRKDQHSPHCWSKVVLCRYCTRWSSCSRPL